MPAKLKTEFTQLTHRERQIAAAYASGLRGRECTAKAGGKHKTDDSARQAINRVLAHPAAREYVEDVLTKATEQVEDDSVMSIIEKRRFLARIRRSHLAQLDPDDPDNKDGDLIKSYSISESEGSTSRRIEKLDPLKAIQLDNELAGHAQAKKVELAADDDLARILADLAGHTEQGTM